MAIEWFYVFVFNLSYVSIGAVGFGELRSTHLRQIKILKTLINGAKP